jgi:hypothetical protein
MKGGFSGEIHAQIESPLNDMSTEKERSYEGIHAIKKVAGGGSLEGQTDQKDAVNGASNDLGQDLVDSRPAEDCQSNIYGFPTNSALAFSTGTGYTVERKEKIKVKEAHKAQIGRSSDEVNKVDLVGSSKEKMCTKEGQLEGGQTMVKKGQRERFIYEKEAVTANLKTSGFSVGPETLRPMGPSMAQKSSMSDN